MSDKSLIVKQQYSIWEFFAIFIIALGLLQFALEEISVISDFPARIRQSIFIIGFIFDIFFLFEFIIRLFNALKNRKLVKYFFSNFGILDLLSSLPVLICFSIPIMINLLNLNFNFIIEPITEFSNLTLLKFPKLSLTIIGLMCLFPVPKNKTHNKIITKKIIMKGIFIGIFLIILGFILVRMFLPVLEQNIEKRKANYKKILTQTYHYLENSDEHKLRYEKTDNYTKEYIHNIFSGWDDFILLEIKKANEDKWGNSYVIYSKYSEKEFRNKFLQSDIYNTDFLHLRILFTNYPFQKKIAKLNLMIFFIISLFVLFYPILYGRVFTKKMF